MNRCWRLSRSLAACALIAALVVPAAAETLNPEGVNPHAAAPKKRITQEQKKAAADARKKKAAEIEARKAAADRADKPAAGSPEATPR